ncbi:MAG: hypothetical protein HXS48_06095 [Theionarchaea archaeon]|nr:hypothetical protein [Theionarchaea archaeon]
MKKSVIILFFLLFSSVQAQPEFVVQEETVEATINSDATVDILYHFTIKTTEGPQRGIYLSIPTGSISNYAASQSGQSLKVERERYRLKIWFSKKAQSGDITELDVRFTAEGLIYPHEGRLRIDFYPGWWEYQKVDILTVTFVLPEGCSISEVDTSPAAETQGMENGKAFIYFERADIALDTDSNTVYPFLKYM